MTLLEIGGLLSSAVTVVGLPFAIFIFIYEQKKARKNEEDEVFQLLSDNYQDFLKVVLDQPDLRLFSVASTADLSEEQKERMLIIFNMLMSLFERAYLLVYDKRMSNKQQRRWHSWEDYMREWCRREDFRELMPQLLRGEDPDFVAYIKKLIDQETAGHSAS